MRKCFHGCLLECISISLDHRARFRPLQKRQKRLGSLVIGPFFQEYRILKNGRMELVRHGPPRAALDGRSGICNRQLPEIPGLEHLLAIRHVDRPAPKHELADRISEAAVRDGVSVLQCQSGPLVIGREENLKRCTMRDLGVESTRSAGDQDRFMTRLFLEKRGDLPRPFVEIGRKRHVSLIRRGGCCHCREHEAKGHCDHPEPHRSSSSAEQLTGVVYVSIYRQWCSKGGTLS